MKAKDVSRAATLVSAIAQIDNLIQHARTPEPQWFGHMFISAFMEKNHLGYPAMHGLVLLDPETTVLVAEAAREIIKAELDKLGVEL